MSMMRWSSVRAWASCAENSRKLKPIGQDAVPEQVGGFLKGGVLGQLVDIDSAVGKHPAFSIDPADSGVGGDNTFQPFPSNSSRHNAFDSPRLKRFVLVDEGLDSALNGGPGAEKAAKTFIT